MKDTLCILYGILLSVNEWIAYQIDHNDFLAGAIMMLGLLSFMYLVGAINIVIGG